jgi:hypothetical protein
MVYNNQNYWVSGFGPSFRSSKYVLENTTFRNIIALQQTEHAPVTLTLNNQNPLVATHRAGTCNQHGAETVHVGSVGKKT